MATVSNLIILFSFISVVYCEEVLFRACSGVSTCDVSAVNIDQCKEPPHKCILKRGRNVTISYNYNPKFSADVVKSMVYMVSGPEDVPFLTMDPDTCNKYTSCPVKESEDQHYSYQLYLGTKLPKGSYSIKWKLWDEKNEESNLCCFTTNIRLK